MNSSVTVTLMKPEHSYPQVCARVSPELHKRLSAMAERSDRTLAYVVRQLLEKALKAEKK